MMEATEPNAKKLLSKSQAVFALAAIIVSVIAYSFVTVPDDQRGEGASPLVATDPFAGISLEAKAAVVIDLNDGATLYSKNPDVQLPLASLTKVPLVLVVTEELPLDLMVTVPYYTGGSGGAEHLLKGEKWRLKDIIDFTLVSSSNTGAEILAELANGPIRKRYSEAANAPAADGATLWRMNELAHSLKLEHTYFLNVSGLDLSATQSGAYGSARDVASLFAYAVSAEPSVFAGTARNGVLLTAPDGQTSTMAENTNESQGAIPGLIMGKTGFTDLAGGNLAVVFDVGLAHPVVAVVLGSTEQGRFGDMQELVSAARASLRSQ